jgi:hypothetical protein
MLKIHEKQYVRFITVEKPTAWIIAVVYIREVGGEIVSVSQPRVIRIISKTSHTLRGSISEKTLLLKGEASASDYQEKIISPYHAPFHNNLEILSWYFARPPTINA